MKPWAEKQIAAAQRKAKRAEKRLAPGLYNGQKGPKSAICGGFIRFLTPSRRPGGVKRAPAPKTPRQILRKTLDTLWSILVRRRDSRIYGGVCPICGKRPITTGYHIVPKQRGDSIRWDLDNGAGTCSPCNGAERWNRSLFRDVRHPQVFGEERCARLVAKAKKKVQFSTADLEDLKTKFDRMIRTGIYE